MKLELTIEQIKTIKKALTVAASIENYKIGATNDAREKAAEYRSVLEAITVELLDPKNF